MLVAHPGDWAVGERGERSFLSLWTEVDGAFVRAGSIGPWHPPGVLWEVPAVIDFGDCQALIISLVDRRGGRTRCRVRYWLGQFGATGFTIRPEFPGGGRLLDHGLDYYAAIPNLSEGWPDADRVVVAWAGDWGAASRPMPGGGHGGPVTLPRVVRWTGDRLQLAPWPAAIPLAQWSSRWDARESARFSIITPSGRCDVAVSSTILSIEQQGKRRTVSLPAGATERDATLFCDADLIELFVAGVSLTWRGTFVDVCSPETR